MATPWNVQECSRWLRFWPDNSEEVEKICVFLDKFAAEFLA
jgi:hypothetical protein